MDALQLRKVDPTFTLIRREWIENGEERVLFAVDGETYEEIGDQHEIIGAIAEQVWRHIAGCPVTVARALHIADWTVVESHAGAVLYADSAPRREQTLPDMKETLVFQRSRKRSRCVNENTMGWLCKGASSQVRKFFCDSWLNTFRGGQAAEQSAALLAAVSRIDTHTKLQIETVEFTAGAPEVCRVTYSTPMRGYSVSGKSPDVIATLCESAWLDSSATLDVLTELSGLPDWFIVEERGKVVAAVERDTAISEIVTVTATSRTTGHVFKVDV